MAITPAEIKKLRDATGVGMMDARKALTDADGDFDQAVELLRISGAAKAAKRSDREASNGLVAAAGHSLIQLGAETDFVAKNQEFVELAEAIVQAIDAAGVDTVAEANDINLPSGQTVAQSIQDLSAKMGEKMELVNVAHFDGDAHIYLHRRSKDLPPQVGVLVEYVGADPDIVHHVALQIAHSNPVYVEPAEVPEEVVDNERRLAAAIAREEGKPEQAITRIVEGRVNGYLKDVCLVNQEPIADQQPTVGALLKQHGITITRFARFAAGPDPARR
ncbi:MAG: translation elongation factor Ts [Propionibacteriaceae bacterium]|jgi:elongation factor Ts|nr:translation elongation factor Ts [Propionibacteriaceae bacterium]